MNTEELRRDLATEEGRGALTRQSPIGRLVAAVLSLLDEIERLRRRAKSDSDGLNRWCDYQDRLFAVMTSDEIRAFDARLTEGGWSNEPLCRHEAEVAALRRQIEAVEAERDRMQATASKIAAFSKWLETTPSYVGRDPEAIVWRRIGKITEENGEVTQAWLGAIGENPRKGVTGCVDDVVRELFDVATCALGAVEHFNGFDGSALSMLADHVAFIYERAGLAALSSVPDVPAARDDEPRGFVDAATIYACFDAGHDVGLRHEDGALYSATCHDCGHRYHRNCPPAPAARDEPDDGEYLPGGPAYPGQSVCDGCDGDRHGQCSMPRPDGVCCDDQYRIAPGRARGDKR